MIRIPTQCRDCKSNILFKFLDLGTQPLANSFVRLKDIEKPQQVYPLEVLVCKNCNLVQLGHVVDKKELYEQYVYFSAGMPEVSQHWQQYARDIQERFLRTPDDLVFEIASNDGILLKAFKDMSFRVLGIDPALNIVPTAEALGIPTIPDFFSEHIAKEMYSQYGSAKTILANNVFAHIDDHHDFCRAVKTLLHKDGGLVIEAPYLLDMFENLTYDTIYHEHLSYLAVRPLIKLFGLFDLEIFDTQLVSVQGQSLRLFVGHKGSHEIRPIVSELVKREYTFGLDTVESYQKLALRIRRSKERLVALLHELKKSGKSIAAYGASAKGNTVLNYCQIGPELLSYAIDDLTSKQGLFTPGMHIPVISRVQAGLNLPDYFLLLAWNYSQAVLEKEKVFREEGGKFIIPVGDDISIL